MTSQIRGGLTGFRTWLHTRWCFFFFVLFFHVCLCTRWDVYLTALTHAIEGRIICTSAILRDSYRRKKKKTLGFKTGAQKVTKCQRWAGGLTSSIPLLFSNDALQKMSNQLSAFPLTFHWQIGKQTHNEEPAGLDGWWLRPMLRWS